MDQQDFSASPAGRSRKSERLLLLFFLFSLPFLNPWVRGDGVGYYAFARAPLIQHNLDFTEDYRHANESFRGPRLDENNQPRSLFRRPTGHLENHFTVGPAILWTPFLLLAHVGVLLSRALGSSVSADGFSAPYRITMALATAFYGFLGLLLAFRLARHYVEERWAFLATLSIWWASSLPVYMYFNPSWSHAHSSFAVALFLWYWHETRSSRSLGQCLILAVITGLMLNVYYPNAMLLAVLAVEAFRQYYGAFRPASSAAPDSAPRIPELFLHHALFAAVVLVCLLPTFITRYLIYGSAFESGYVPLRDWNWFSPRFLAVLFSSNHGLLAWTPILLLFFRSRRAALAAAITLLAVCTLWNAGLIFQWGSHLIPARGPVAFSEVVHNQFFVVPRQLSSDLQRYFFRRKALMQQIEDRDLQQLEKNPLP